jgi:hypothetical protein
MERLFSKFAKYVTSQDLAAVVFFSARQLAEQFSAGQLSEQVAAKYFSG